MNARAEKGDNLLVLAGPKGAGKTTLLSDALTTKTALFGSAVNACFQATQCPNTDMEFRLPLAEVIQRKTWACNTHLAELARRTPPLANLVAHLDIMDFCRFNARPFESILDAGENLTEMQRNPCAAIFAAYRSTHLATLNTPYDRCAPWYNARAVTWRKAPSANDERLYADSDEGRAAFAAVSEAWLLFAASLGNVAAHWRIDYDGETVSVAPA